MDKPFRPTKAQNQDPLEKVTEVRESIESETFDMPEIKGNIPKEFQDKMRNVSEEPPQPKREQPTPQQAQQQLGGYQLDNTLQSLLEKIQDKTHNYEEVTLPSVGRFYDGSDGPTDGKLHVRPMTGKEEEILATPRFVKKGQYLDMIFRNCIREPFDPAKFLLVDREFLLIYLRGISYTADYEAELRCPICDYKFQESIDLDELSVDYCPQHFGEEKLRDVLPITEIPFSFHLSRGTDDKKIQDYRQKKKNFDAADNADDILLYRLAIQLNEIGGLSDTQSILVLLQNLPINDVSYLRNAIIRPPFGVNTTIEVICQGCQSDFEIELPMDSSFFFPRTRRKNQGHQ